MKLKDAKRKSRSGAKKTITGGSLELPAFLRQDKLKNIFFRVVLAIVICFLASSKRKVWKFVLNSKKDIAAGGLKLPAVMFLALTLAVSSFMLAGEVNAFNFSGSLKGLAEEVELSSGQNPPSLAAIVGGIIYGALGLLGVVSLLVIIIAGYRWMMAGGNEETVAQARAYIKNAIIGVIISLGAYAITYFVISRLI